MKRLVFGFVLLLGTVIVLVLPARPACAQNVHVQVDLADEHMYNPDSGDQLYLPISAVQEFSDGSIGSATYVPWGGTIYADHGPDNITGRIDIANWPVNPGEVLLMAYNAIYRKGPSDDP